MKTAYLFLLLAALRKHRRRNISGSASRCWRNSRYQRSNSGGAVCMTFLTWIAGLRNISSEGGPERMIYGP